MGAKKELEFELSEMIQIHHADKQSGTSEILDTNKLILKAPSYNTYDERIRLRQGYMQAVKALQSTIKDNVPDQSDSDGDTNDKITGEVVINVLYMSDIEMVPYMKIFEALLLNVCYVDGKVQLTKTILNKIDLDDLERMLGEYIANFIIPSSMK